MNPQFLFFDGHDSHWDADALDMIVECNVHSFFLKAVDYTKDQPNDNGPNACLKECYNEELSEWIEKFGTKKYTPAHMNGVVV